MKIVLNPHKKDTIKLKNITSKHLVVGTVDGNPVILNKPFEDKMGIKYNFLIINEKFSIGNAYNFRNNYKSSHEIVKDAILEYDAKLEVFEEKDWKKALQWLIDNAY